MGEDYVNEFIMFSYDVPLSKHFVYRGYATFAERFRRVLKTQPGFNDLNDKDQVSILISCGNKLYLFVFAFSSKNVFFNHLDVVSILATALRTM